MLKKSSWLTNEFRNDDFYTASIDKEFLVIKFKIIGKIEFLIANMKKLPIPLGKFTNLLAS